MGRSRGSKKREREKDSGRREIGERMNRRNRRGEKKGVGESEKREAARTGIGSALRASRPNGYTFNGYANGPSVTR